MENGFNQENMFIRRKRGRTEPKAFKDGCAGGCAGGFCPPDSPRDLRGIEGRSPAPHRPAKPSLCVATKHNLHREIKRERRMFARATYA